MRRIFQSLVAGDGTSIVRNGRLGIIDRFTLYCSNNLTTASGVTQCMAGVKDFAGFASQFIKHESLTLEKHFGMGHRGLQVYGYKVLKPDAGVLLAAKRS